MRIMARHSMGNSVHGCAMGDLQVLDKAAGIKAGS
jgi:hypothetical protein